MTSNTSAVLNDKAQETGLVKWFCDQRGYGFLAGQNISGDIFAHHSEIMKLDGFKNLRKGQKVSFELVEDCTQKKAKQICILT
jgi:CspA family cold shock protein